MSDAVERARAWVRDVHRGSAVEIIADLLDEIDRLQQDCAIHLMSRAEQADEAQRWRDRHTRLTELGRAVAAVTPCACSAQRARAEKAEAERDELAAKCDELRRGEDNAAARVLELRAERDKLSGALAEQRMVKNAYAAERDELAATVERVRAYADDRALYGKRDRTVGSMRIASDLRQILAEPDAPGLCHQCDASGECQARTPCSADAGEGDQDE